MFLLMPNYHTNLWFNHDAFVQGAGCRLDPEIPASMVRSVNDGTVSFTLPHLRPALPRQTSGKR